MRGSPIFVLIFATVGLFFVGLLTAAVTRPAQPVVDAQELPLPPPLPEEEEGILLLEFGSPVAPSLLRVMSGDSVLWVSEEPGPAGEKRIQFSYPTKGTELVVEVEWEQHLPGERGLRMRAVFQEDEEISERIFWGPGNLHDIWRLPPRVPSP